MTGEGFGLLTDRIGDYNGAPGIWRAVQHGSPFETGSKSIDLICLSFIGNLSGHGTYDQVLFRCFRGKRF
jgi:subtilisin family serine protease